jgi:putative ABC transport system substrate-binding protein
MMRADVATLSAMTIAADPKPKYGCRVTRRQLIALLLASAPALGARGANGQVRKPWRIGLLGDAGFWDRFRQGLESAGYKADTDFVLDKASIDGNFEALPKAAAVLLEHKIDIMVTAGATATRAAKQATATVPIVMIAGIDPVAASLVDTVARPGGNLTGIMTQLGALNPKRLELLQEALPSARQVAILVNRSSAGSRQSMETAEQAAGALGLTLRLYEVARPSDIAGAFAAMTAQGNRALMVLPSSMFLQERAQIVSLALASRLPTMVAGQEYVEAGGLMSYAADFSDMYVRAADYVVRILKGTRPAELPVEQASKFELVVNLKTAKALGLSLPASILSRADRVIE